jgi:hypothetical protein
VAWSVSPTNLFAVDAGNGTSFTTRATSATSSGYGQITADVIGDCGAISKTYEVYVGKPETATNPVDPICIGEIVQDNPFTLPESPGADDYYLESNSPYLYVYDPNPVPGQEIRLFTNLPGTYSIDLTTSNICGVDNSIIYISAIDCSGSGCGGFICLNSTGEQFNLYPIPVDNEMQYEFTSTNSTIGTESVGSTKDDFSNTEIFIVDVVYPGNPIITQKLTRQKGKINLRGLKKGMYHLVLKRNGITYKKNFVKN